MMKKQRRTVLEMRREELAWKRDVSRGREEKKVRVRKLRQGDGGMRSKGEKRAGKVGM